MALLAVHLFPNTHPLSLPEPTIVNSVFVRYSLPGLGEITRPRSKIGAWQSAIANILAIRRWKLLSQRPPSGALRIPSVGFRGPQPPDVEANISPYRAKRAGTAKPTRHPRRSRRQCRQQPDRG